MPMSLERRVALLEWAQERGAIIMEDDYDGEFRFEGRPLESLKSLDRAGLVAALARPDLRLRRHRFERIDAAMKKLKSHLSGFGPQGRAPA
jgi:hypothetical protein